jgi:hypothetical protein
VLAEDVIVVDPTSTLWRSARPLLEAALGLEQKGEEGMSWRGWRKQSIDAFLRELPDHCALMVGVWDDESGESGQVREHELLVVGFVCEVHMGEVRTIRTLEVLRAQPEAGLPPIQDLEPGFQHAFDLMRAVRTQIAPVAWALFTDWATWNEWIYGNDQQEAVIDKGAVLSELALQGRCVLMGSQASHHHV